ncbi:MAG TPA: GNAT family N-acetyltransferase [Roseiflexaceae bacterium]|nr:GNAT family N-acetyltransferase [Roseiflexaceae bacterium]
MHLLTPSQAAALLDWFGPERPGPLVAQHVALTGNGAVFVDRWPEPRAALAATADNLTLAGDPAVLTPEQLRRHVIGFLDAPESFAPLLREAFPDMAVWDRVIFALEGPLRPAPPADAEVRRLGPDDAYQLWALSRESGWVAKTWSGPPGLAASGMAWGGFVEGRLVAVACTFFLGRGHEEIGVATEPGFRRRGLSAACAAGLCADIIARGRTPSWTTSPDNVASMRVAEKLGFTLRRRDVLYVVGIPIPQP